MMQDSNVLLCPATKGLFGGLLDMQSLRTSACTELPTDSDSRGLGWGPGSYISDLLPGDANVAGQETILPLARSPDYVIILISEGL